MGKCYEYLRDGAVHGPLTAKEIRRLVARGELGLDDVIRVASPETVEGWLPIRKVKNLHVGEAKDEAEPREATETSAGSEPAPGVFVDTYPSLPPPAAHAEEAEFRLESEASPRKRAYHAQSSSDVSALLVDCLVALLGGVFWFVLTWPVGFFARWMLFKTFGV
ncbi:MAG: hypothetical protein AB7K24_32760 [Gemmataceae bacterium]